MPLNPFKIRPILLIFGEFQWVNSVRNWLKFYQIWPIAVGFLHGWMRNFAWKWVLWRPHAPNRPKINLHAILRFFCCLCKIFDLLWHREKILGVGGSNSPNPKFKKNWIGLFFWCSLWNLRFFWLQGKKLKFWGKPPLYKTGDPNRRNFWTSP